MMPTHTTIQRAKGRPFVGAIVFLALTCAAQPIGTLPAELEPYFNAIRMVESRGHPWSIFDNTTRQSYKLASRAEAEAKAAELIKYGHNVDLGLMQLNCRYQCNRPGVSLANIFDPEVNVNTAKIIFLEFWDQARRISTDFTARIIAAVGAYNNGRVGTPNVSYVQKVWRQMGKATDGLPDQTTSKPEPGAPNKGFMDEAFARAEKGASWARERWEEISRKSKGTTDPEREKTGTDTNASPGIIGSVLSTVVTLAVLVIAAPLLIKIGAVWIKLMGGKAGAARAAAGYANRRKKATEEQVHG